MQKIVLLMVIFMLLSACAAPPASPAPTETLTATPSPTETPVPTSTPTLTLTPTLTSTPSPTPVTPQIKEAMGYFADIGISTDGFKFTVERGGFVIGVDKNGNEAYRNGLDLLYFIQNVSGENLEKTTTPPLNMPTIVDPPLMSDLARRMYSESKLLAVYPERQYTLTGILLRDYSRDGATGYAWGKVIFDNGDQLAPRLAYYDAQGGFHFIPLEKGINEDTLDSEFWSHPEIYK